MTILRLLVFLCLVVVATAGGAVARCEGALMLSGLHDAYSATLRGDTAIRKRAAMSLLVFLGGQESDSLAAKVSRAGVDVDAERLSEILSDAQTLAKATLADDRSDETIFRHGQNVEWLSRLYLTTGCKTSQSVSSHGSGGGDEGNAPGNRGTARRTDSDGTTLSKEAGPIAALAFAALLSGLGYGAYRFSKSFFMRRRIVERMPRFPVALSLDLTFTDPDGNMRQASATIVDVSQGGLKLSWSEPPPQKTLVTVSLLGTQRLAHVMWSNHHYAGLMFETKLSKPELKSLMETHPPT